MTPRTRTILATHEHWPSRIKNYSTEYVLFLKWWIREIINICSVFIEAWPLFSTFYISKPPCPPTSHEFQCWSSTFFFFCLVRVYMYIHAEHGTRTSFQLTTLQVAFIYLNLNLSHVRVPLAFYVWVWVHELCTDNLLIQIWRLWKIH